MGRATTADNILIVNLHSSRNAGDAVLLERTVQQLRGAMPEARIVLALNDLRSKIETEGIDRVGSFMSHILQVRSDRTVRWRLARFLWHAFRSCQAALWYRITGRMPTWVPKELRQLLTAYATADMVVSCPGNIFFTMGRVGLPFLVSAFTTGYALLVGKPLYIMPQSVGPLNRRWERAVVRALFSRARLVYVREPVSLDLVRALGVRGEECRLSPDLAFAFPAAPSHEAEKLLDQFGLRRVHPRIGVTVINRMVRSVDGPSWERYQESVAGTLTRFHAAHGGSSVFFPQVTGPTLREDDRVTARQIAAHVSPPRQAVVVESPVSPGLLKGVYGHMDLFIATRMHSGIFALSMGIPTLFIAYLHKTHGLADMLGLSEWVIDIGEASEARLLGRLESLWEQRVAVRRHLQHEIPLLIDKANKVGLSIVGDYREWQDAHSLRHRGTSPR